MVSGISHVTFIVSDLQRMTEFLTHIFDARQVYDSGEKQFSLSRERFFLIGGVWVCIMEGEPLPQRSYNHVAFHVPDEELDGYIQRIGELGARMRPPRPRVSGEGRSVYFYDWDNHLFELHTGTLEERLERYRQ